MERAQLGNSLQELLLQKKELWAEFYRLTLAQGECLAPDKTGKLIELVERKEECIEAINKLDKKIEGFKGNNFTAGSLEGLHNPLVSEKDVTGFSKLREEIYDLIRKSYEADKLNRERVNENFVSCKKDLENFRAAKDVALNYEKVLKTGKGYFVDKNL